MQRSPGGSFFHLPRSSHMNNLKIPDKQNLTAYIMDSVTPLASNDLSMFEYVWIEYLSKIYVSELASFLAS